ncbi:hypothetical protein PWT90_07352 [Aphanocladium album]|nr:hypothetical protein PWT90_07352 [Aphanocladium album]
MAPLASIPEGSNAQSFSLFSKLNDTKNTSTNKHRPQSRVFVASRRHTRSRYQRPERTEYFASRPAPSSTCPAPEWPSRSNFDNIHTTPETNFGEQPDPSDSSFDLDSFPLPPSTSSTLSRHGHGPPISSSSSASITASENYVNQRYKASRARHAHAQVDGASDPTTSCRASVDTALVNAITRNIVQQFRLSSVGRYRQNQTQPKSNVARSKESRTSSQQDAIDNFTKDLEQYVRRRGNPRKRSLATLQTVSALMPFRSEFENAGLAVTSKDQANRIHSYITKAVEARAPTEAGPSSKPGHAKPAASKLSQMDGWDDTCPSDSPNTEISFAPSNGMDEWRYAMIEEVPQKKKKGKATGGKKGKKHCLSCFNHSPSTATEGGWAQPQKLPTAAVPKFRGGIGPPPPVPPPPMPPQRPPRPDVGLFDSEPTQRPKPTASNMTSTSHALSPKMLPTFSRHKDKGKSPVRRGSPHPRVLASKLESSPMKKRRSSPKRKIPHETTSKQYDRTLHQATPLDLKTAVEEARKDEEFNNPNSGRLPDVRGYTVDHSHIGICCRSNRGVPSRANARPNIPRRTSSMSQLKFSSKFDYDDREITDRDVLRGLHIAASAACDEEVDAFVRNQTGLRVRRFLADLMTLETLAVNPPIDKRQWARQRRADMRKLKEQMRRSREINSIAQANYL